MARDKIGRPNQSDSTGTEVQGTVDGSRRRGRPKKSWIDNIAEWTSKSFAEEEEETLFDPKCTIHITYQMRN